MLSEEAWLLLLLLLPNWENGQTFKLKMQKLKFLKQPLKEVLKQCDATFHCGVDEEVGCQFQ